MRIRVAEDSVTVQRLEKKKGYSSLQEGGFRFLIRGGWIATQFPIDRRTGLLDYHS